MSLTVDQDASLISVSRLVLVSVLVVDLGLEVTSPPREPVSFSSILCEFEVVMVARTFVVTYFTMDSVSLHRAILIVSIRRSLHVHLRALERCVNQALVYRPLQLHTGGVAPSSDLTETQGDIEPGRRTPPCYRSPLSQ